MERGVVPNILDFIYLFIMNLVYVYKNSKISIYTKAGGVGSRERLSVLDNREAEGRSAGYEVKHLALWMAQ